MKSQQKQPKQSSATHRSQNSGKSLQGTSAFLEKNKELAKFHSPLKKGKDSAKREAKGKNEAFGQASNKKKTFYNRKKVIAEAQHQEYSDQKVNPEKSRNQSQDSSYCNLTEMSPSSQAITKYSSQLDQANSYRILNKPMISTSGSLQQKVFQISNRPLDSYKEGLIRKDSTLAGQSSKEEKNFSIVQRELFEEQKEESDQLLNSLDSSLSDEGKGISGLMKTHKGGSRQQFFQKNKMKNIRTKEREMASQTQEDDEDIEIFEVNNALSQKMLKLKSSQVSNENNCQSQKNLTKYQQYESGKGMNQQSSQVSLSLNRVSLQEIYNNGVVDLRQEQSPFASKKSTHNSREKIGKFLKQKSQQKIQPINASTFHICSFNSQARKQRIATEANAGKRPYKKVQECFLSSIDYDRENFSNYDVGSFDSEKSIYQNFILEEETLNRNKSHNLLNYRTRQEQVPRQLIIQNPERGEISPLKKNFTREEVQSLIQANFHLKFVFNKSSNLVKSLQEQMKEMEAKNLKLEELRRKDKEYQSRLLQDVRALNKEVAALTKKNQLAQTANNHRFV